MTTRPMSVCSDCASIVHPLGKWLDITLQPIVKSQPAYFQDLFSLKLELNDLQLPPYASLFTFNAISMYTNIDIVNCIKLLSTFFSSILFREEVKAIVKALHIVMRNNCMQFGDLIFRQI